MIENEQTEGEGATSQPVDTDAQATEPKETEAAALARERDELRDRLLRKTAEFDNYRKRVEKERRELGEWAAADVISEVLAVLDDFDRALETEAPPEAQGYRAGVELIRRQLGEVLRKRGVTT